MPTIWKAEEIYKSIEQFKRLQYKNVELIIIDNTHSNFYDNDPRIIVVKCSNNIFVNPAWNIGVKLARNKYICLLNDDIYFNYIPLINSFPQFIESYPNLGLIGFNNLTLKIDGELNDDNDKLELFDTTLSLPYAYGCCLFLKKEDYIQLDESYKIFYGDTLLITSIIDIKRKYMYYIDNIKCIGRISVSSDAYPESMDIDRIAFHEQYNNIISIN
jgi:hypothetical protein